MTRTALHFVILLGSCPLLFGQTLKPPKLPHGQFPVGYKTISIWYPQQGGDSIPLVLNLWYPTERPAGNKIRLVDFTFSHLLAGQTINDSNRDVYVSSLRKNTDRWFGQSSEEKWEELRREHTYSTRQAPYHKNKFPLILGRLRVFSTTFSNEYVASHGYVVCMMNPVEDFPQDNAAAYQQQVTNEINFYTFIRKYLHNTLSITSPIAGLMGFSGSGLSQFMTPMVTKDFSAVALLESGVYLNGVFEVLSTHRAYAPEKFDASLLFLYNEERFEKLSHASNFSALRGNNKHLVLFDSDDQHHWDFATEGILASLFLQTRPEKTAMTQIRLFNTMNTLIVEFFDYYLKNKPQSFVNRQEKLIVR
jgi:hypothetical protein